MSPPVIPILYLKALPYKQKKQASQQKQLLGGLLFVLQCQLFIPIIKFVVDICRNLCSNKSEIQQKYMV